MDRLTTGLDYILAFINNVPAHSWYVLGSVFASSTIVVGIVLYLQRRQLRKYATKLKTHFVYINLIVWSTVTAALSFVITNGNDFAVFLPFLTDKMPAIMSIATSLFVFSKAAKAWFTDRKNNKPLVMPSIDTVVETPVIDKVNDPIPPTPPNLWQ